MKAMLETKRASTDSLPADFLRRCADSEKGLVGAILLSSLGSREATGALIESVCETVSLADFVDPLCKASFRSILSLFEDGQKIGVISVASSIGKSKDITGSVSVKDLQELSYLAANPDDALDFAKVVKEHSNRRKIFQLLGTFKNQAVQDFDKGSAGIVDVLADSISGLFDEGKSKTDLVRLSDALVANIEKIDDLYHSGDTSGISGLKTGFADLDQDLSGLQKQDLVIVAGRPSMGKTSFAFELAKNICQIEKTSALVFSLEMPAAALSLRALSSESGIGLQALRSARIADPDWNRLTHGVEKLSDCDLYIDESNSLSPSDVRSRARKLSRKVGKIGLILIDYLQLMNSSNPSNNREQEISSISRDLKKIAREFDCPVVVLSQLNRSLEQRANKRPIMSDLRESGAIEQDADVIMFVYRDEVYNPDTPDRGVAEIIIGKQRNGPIGTVRLRFLSQTAKFVDYYGVPEGY